MAKIARAGRYIDGALPVSVTTRASVFLGDTRAMLNKGRRETERAEFLPTESQRHREETLLRNAVPGPGVAEALVIRRGRKAAPRRNTRGPLCVSVTLWLIFSVLF